MTSTLQTKQFTNISLADVHISKADLNQDTSITALSSVETYLCGQGMGQEKYHLYNAYKEIETCTSLLENVLVLIDWWSQSDYIHYGELTLCNVKTNKRLVELELRFNFNKSQINKSKLAFFSGILSGFYGLIIDSDYGAIAHSGTQSENVYKIFLGCQDALNPIPFWQIMDS